MSNQGDKSRTSPKKKLDAIKFPTMIGNARMAVGASHFEVPLFSQITDKLWTGCSPAEFPDELESVGYSLSIFVPHRRPVRCHWLVDGDKPRFDCILNLFPWERYIVPEGTLMATDELYDAEDLPAVEVIDLLAKKVIGWLDEGHQVLVHCQAGLNRSSLVAARTLMLWRGMTADAAIARIREKRSPMCLCNGHFEGFLRGLDAEAAAV